MSKAGRPKGTVNPYPFTREADNHFLRENVPTPEELEEVDKVLKILGYDKDFILPIYVQFHLRHGLPLD